MIYGRQSAQSWVKYLVANMESVLRYMCLTSYLASDSPCVTNITIATYCYILFGHPATPLDCWLIKKRFQGHNALQYSE